MTVFEGKESTVPAADESASHRDGVRPTTQDTNRRRLVARASTRREKMIAFGYYGGKFSHLDFILPLLPEDYAHYCEPFGGSGAVLINRNPAPVETYNDLDSELVTFFRCLRDQNEELIRQIALTPFSREELILANKRESDLNDVEIVQRLLRVQVENAPQSVFVLGGEAIRVAFLRRVGEHLDQWNTQPSHRQAWKSLLESL